MSRLSGRIRNRAVRGAFQVLFRPVRDQGLARLGTDYGGWWIPTGAINSDSICYLAGVGTDISFDTALIERFGCRAWGIDPTPKSIEWIANQELDPRYTFVPIGLSDRAGSVRFYKPKNAKHVSHSMKNLQQTSAYITAEVVSVGNLMELLGHDRIDLLKLDIEGAEHDTIRSMLSDGIRPKVLCVEFDQPEPMLWARSTLAALRDARYDVLKVEGLNVLLKLDSRE